MSTNPVEDNSTYSWKIKEWFPELEDKVVSALKLYADILIKFNKTINLVGPKTIPFLDSLHFSDSIMAQRIILENSPNIDHIYDFGSGNGFPGLVFGILEKKMKVTLVDSDSRKIEFLKHVISNLQLNNVFTVNSTIENLPQNSVNFAVSRGLANISKSILVARKCFSKKGIYFHMKSEQWGLEVSEIPIQLCSIWEPALVKEYKLPVVPVKFAIIATTKI